MRFALELLSRNEHRTVSSFIEKILDQAISNNHIQLIKTLEEIENERGHLTPKDFVGLTADNTKSVLASEAVKLLWHVDEAHRFIMLAFHAPQLLTYEEEVMWEFIKRCDYYWTYYYVNAKDLNGKDYGRRLTRIFDPSGVVWERLHEHWDYIKEGKFDELGKFEEGNVGKFDHGKIIERPENEPEEAIILRFPSNIAKQRPNTVEAKFDDELRKLRTERMEMLEKSKKDEK